MMVYIGIDQSKRSTGVVSVNERGELLSYRLLCYDEQDDTLVLLYQSIDVRDFVRRVKDDVGGVMMEGLSFGAVGSGKDFLAGLQHVLKKDLLEYYHIHAGTAPVSMWRSKVLSKQEQKEAKALGKDGLKRMAFEKMPAEVREAFSQYVAAKKFKKTSLWDLCDAYWIAQFCRACHQKAN